MLIKLLFSAMVFGAGAVSLALALGYSIWVVLTIYSLVGSSVLIAGGLIAASHATVNAQKIDFGGAQLKSADIRVRS